MINYKYIAIEGNIGVGKTSLAKLFSKDLPHNLILEEFKKNPFLPKFYKTPGKLLLPLEMTFLFERYHQLTNLPKKGKIIGDYIFQKSKIFAKNNLSITEFDVFSKVFHVLNKNIIQPDLLILLENTIPNLQKNIARRGRKFENSISEKYLFEIEMRYHNFLKQNKFFRIIRVNVENIDFVHHSSDFKKMFNLLEEKYPKGNTIIKL